MYYRTLLGNRDYTEKVALKWEKVLHFQMSRELIGQYTL